MRKIVAALVAVLIVVEPTAVWAQVTTTLNKGRQKGSLLTRVSDWFATADKSQEEKYVIQKNRRAARKTKKAKGVLARKKRQFARERQKAYSQEKETETVTVK